jgi:hypothetical protein
MWISRVLVVTMIAIMVYFGYNVRFSTIPIPTPSVPMNPQPIASPAIPTAQLPPPPSALPSALPSISGFSWLQKQGFVIDPKLLQSIESILNYTKNNQIEHNHILTVIDYSLPANQKRLWVFDLQAQKVLFHTYVSHGLKSGGLSSNFFSNRFNSKASSIGVYRTDKTYYGRHGLSLKLDGLDRGFNDNADMRAIVMHGGWYVEESFIQKYGRAGRSWGCPAVPDQLTGDIINTIKDKSLFVIYYPSTEWFEKSRFLQHETDASVGQIAQQSNVITETENREDVLLAQINKKHKYQETEAILAVPVDYYTALFQTSIPLERMIRRQVEQQEYIALSKTEFDQLLKIFPQNSTVFQRVYFLLPEIKMIRGYYATEMKKVKLTTITAIQPNSSLPTKDNYYTVYFADHSSLSLKTTHRFIRWLGL